MLAYAAEEAKRLSHKHIGTEHLLLGLLREEKCFASGILHERGLRLWAVREELAAPATQEKAGNAAARNREFESAVGVLPRAPTQAAMDAAGWIRWWAATRELERVVQILCRRTKNNPC